MPLATTDPLDFTDKYNTPLPANRQADYSQWLNALPKQLQNSRDYDLQGAFLSGAGPSSNAHLTDQFKKPNHATFSDQSQYNGVDGYTGGKWTDNGYQPSATNLQFRAQPELQKYFNEVEPGIPLLPAPTPTGQHGNYTMADLSGTAAYRVKPQAAIAPQPLSPRKFYGQ
jgi:hypothetical protein